jgi:hypothetical protein
MKLSPIIYTLGLLLSVFMACNAYRDGKAMAEKAETDRAMYYSLNKMFDAEIAYTNLEMKRTTVQREVREMVIAEWKKCNRKGCK